MIEGSGTIDRKLSAETGESAAETAARLAAAWDARLAGLLHRLPERPRKAVAWLQHPSRRAMRLVVGVLLCFGSLLAILPVFGVWMLPLGLALIGEDFPAVKVLLERTARWGEHMWARLRSR